MKSQIVKRINVNLTEKDRENIALIKKITEERNTSDIIRAALQWYVNELYATNIHENF